MADENGADRSPASPPDGLVPEAGATRDHGVARRRFLTTSLSAGPLVLTVKARSAWAQDGQTESALASETHNLSEAPQA